MDDLNGEVSNTEVVGIEPGEQAPARSFPLAVAGRVRTPFPLGEPVCVCLWSVSARPPGVLQLSQVDSSRASLLARPCNR